ncbi:c-type cytochrome biogenesis protein CcsB [Saccharothrix sp. AJ9571]|nr:c-type cytochrome biogenesis protein CcsB [Saccharothrix sp. AJ9571]
MNIAATSNALFLSAAGIYTLAALLSAAEYSLTRYPARTRGTGRIAFAERDLADRFGRLGVAITVLGALLHLGSIVLRGVATARPPWGNMFEYISVVGFIAVTAWLYVIAKHRIRRAAVFVLLPTALLLFLAGNLLYAEVAPLQPSLRSYWIVVHVFAAIMASGVFLVSGIASALHLVAIHRPARRLPPPIDLDKVAYRTGVFGFLTMTVAVLAGAVWAEAAWGRYWGWDPKETTAFISWICYAAYLHARSTAGWRHRRAAWVNVIGLLAVLFNLFFVNLVASGLHSYTGIE